MGAKRRKIYEALVAGTTEGLSDKALYEFVVKQCPKTSSKKIVRAALLALTDPEIADRNVLDTIYALAIKHRMAEIGHGDEGDDHDDEPEIPAVKPSRKRTKATEAPTATA